MVRKLCLFLATTLFFTACYHARIETGLTPSTIKYEKTFASAWIYGLVPPDVVMTTEKCRNGVAIVETKLSFVNQLVGAITFGIYTPMHITVTCAEISSAGIDQKADYVIVAEGTSNDDLTLLVEGAIQRSADTESPVYLVFE